MKYRVFGSVVVLSAIATPAFAHRIDEYLQATTIAVEADHVTLQMHMTPGIKVYDAVFKTIDADADGVISSAEQTAYAAKVRDDLVFAIDKVPTTLQVMSVVFPKPQELKEGIGTIVITLRAPLTVGAGTRSLHLENHHDSKYSVYLVNSLVPKNPDIHIVAQTRNFTQAIYQLDYTSMATPVAAASSGTASLFWAYVYQGIHHILTGYDHLLFVSALVLAAATLWDVVKVVFAFTLAHTLTLTLAAFDLVHVPSNIVEPLIAASIVFIAVQNVFWPKRAKGWVRLGSAFFFGLFHGLGFAGGLLDAMREMPGTTLVLAIVAFSVGVEAGHQMVVVPLYFALKKIRSSSSDTTRRTNVAIILQRSGSALISIAGTYYLWIALTQA